MALKKYQSKRNFESTPEPRGAVEKANGSLRFVVHKHAASHLHYDLRLEMDGVLKSWAVPKGPSLNPQDKRLAVHVEDHPLDYRTFEGNIPEGNYGAGSVMIWDEGTYTSLHSKTTAEAEKELLAGLKKGHLTFIMDGQKLKGEFALIKLKRSDDDKAWLLVKANKDKWASKSDITKQDHSAETDRTMGQIAGGVPPTKVNVDPPKNRKTPLPASPRPMLAVLGDHPSSDSGWWYEVKWDGYRIMAQVTPNGTKLVSRNGQDYTAKFAPIAAELTNKLKVPALLDGEVVVVDPTGKSNFGALQRYIKTGQGLLVYYVFDALHVAGHDATQLPLSKRYDILSRILPKSNRIRLSEHIVGRGAEALARAKQMGLEGLIAKRADSTYSYGARSTSWLKLKTHKRQEAIILGFTKPQGGRSHFGALILGVYKGKELTYVGHVGTGFNDADLAFIYKKMLPHQTQVAPVTNVPKTNAPATWLKPTLVCEVQFTEWTTDNQMRHPVFLGLREDKPASQIVREEPVSLHEKQATKPEGPPAKPEVQLKPKPGDKTLRLGINKKITVSHLDKLYWPNEKITKGDLINYYKKAAKVMLPYLKDRPHSLNRFPNGIDGESFYQKNIEHPPEWATTRRVHLKQEDRDVNYLICKDIMALIYMVNMGCIEINPWNSKLPRLAKPDWAVIDLDPEDVDFYAVIKTAHAVKRVLDAGKIKGYIKTTGSRGIHIFIPLGGKYTYDQARDFAHVIAQLTHSLEPEITSLERSPSKRQGKVYLDYLQNSKGQTLAAPYSVRPREGATVSAPISWDELQPTLSPKQFTMFNISKRFKLDKKLWRPVLGRGINVDAAIKRLEKWHNERT